MNLFFISISSIENAVRRKSRTWKQSDEFYSLEIVRMTGNWFHYVNIMKLLVTLFAHRWSRESIIWGIHDWTRYFNREFWNFLIPSFEIHFQGLAFTLEERQALGIHGLQPARFKSQEEQLELCKISINRYQEDLNKYLYLIDLQVNILSFS